MFLLIIGAGLIFCLDKCYYKADDCSLYECPEDMKNVVDETQEIEAFRQPQRQYSEKEQSKDILR